MSSHRALFWWLCTLVSSEACANVADLGPPKGLESKANDGGTSAADDVGMDGGPGSGGAPDSGPAPDSGSASSVKSVLLVALGPDVACAVVDVGSSAASNLNVRCWGSNSHGQLGGATGTSFSSTPVMAGTLTPVSEPTDGDLAIATSYACAVNSSHHLSCWGNVASDVPQTLAEVNAASVSENGGCLVYGVPSALKCWGAFTPPSGNGVVPQDGGGAVVDNAFQSVVVEAAGVCGVHNGGGDVYCWSGNQGPTPVGISGTVLKIAGAMNNTCALVAEDAAQAATELGSVYCWGANGNGQVGIDSNGFAVPAPTRVNLASAATAIAVGETHACAALQDGSVWCWGDNSSQQLGIGPSPIAGSTLPQGVQRLSHTGTPIPLGNVKLIAAGGQTTCAIDANFSTMWCWGANDLGQAGQDGSGLSISERVVSYATPVAW